MSLYSKQKPARMPACKQDCLPTILFDFESDVAVDAAPLNLKSDRRPHLHSGDDIAERFQRAYRLVVECMDDVPGLEIDVAALSLRRFSGDDQAFGLA